MLKKEYNLTFIEDNCHSLTNHNNYKLESMETYLLTVLEKLFLF